MQLVIPAYNEAARLPATLESVRAFAGANPTGEALRILVVDNASTDGTAAVARSFDGPNLAVSVLHCGVAGKGAAVRAGILHALSDRTAAVVGFMDADGATDLSALSQGLDLIRGGADMAIGSRAVDGSVTMARHSQLRHVGATVYRRQTQRIAPGIADTQCGFKLMRCDLARRVFTPLQCAGFSFDVELLGRAQRLGAKIAEFPVVWIDVPGSKFRPARNGVSAFWELARIGRLLGTHSPVADVVAARAELPVAALNGVAES